MKVCLIALIILIALPAYAGTKDKKLIEYGWDWPGTAYVREHVQEMEKTPFDGVVLCVNLKTDSSKTTGGNSYGWKVFSSERFANADCEHAIIDLKATKFKRFTDNFVQVIAHPGDVDWFDPQWSSVAENAACLARVAKQGGCAGIMFDPEIYGPEVKTWNYSKFPAEWKAKHTYAEYQQMVRQRGREFIRAINKEFPDIAILCLYGYCLPYVQKVLMNDGKLEGTDYELLPDFYDGICEAATAGTTLIDGHEWSYPYKKRDEFVESRNRVFDSLKLSKNPKAVRKHLRAGMALWLDYNSGYVPWNTQDLSKNHFTPEQFRASLNYALEQSDKYVWVYTERTNWWGRTVPQPYVDALELCKKGFDKE